MHRPRVHSTCWTTFLYHCGEPIRLLRYTGSLLGYTLAMGSASMTPLSLRPQSKQAGDRLYTEDMQHGQQVQSVTIQNPFATLSRTL